MNSPQDEVLLRLSRLEKENQRIRSVGVLLLVFTIIILTVAAQGGRRTVTANEFILQDEQGHVRAQLFMDSKGASLVFLDAAGRKQMSLGEQVDALGRGHASLKLGEGAATGRFILAGSSKEDWTTISDGGVFLAGKGTTRVVLSASGPDSPGIEVADSEGYSTQVGVTRRTYPTTGETQKSSAASLVLLGKDQAVLWSAP
jgi:hypothetical protein